MSAGCPPRGVLTAWERAHERWWGARADHPAGSARGGDDHVDEAEDEAAGCARRGATGDDDGFCHDGIGLW